MLQVPQGRADDRRKREAMKRKIVITIDCAEDGVRCGECRFSRNARACTRQCFLFHRKIPAATHRDDAMRLPECLAAERKMRALLPFLAHSDDCPLGDPFHDAGDEDCSCGLGHALADLEREP